MRWIAPLSLAVNVLTLALVVGLVSREEPATPLDLGSIETVLGRVQANVDELAARPAQTLDPALSEQLSGIAAAVNSIGSAMADEQILDELSGVCARLDDLYSELANVPAPPGFGC